MHTRRQRRGPTPAACACPCRPTPGPPTARSTWRASRRRSGPSRARGWAGAGAAAALPLSLSIPCSLALGALCRMLAVFVCCFPTWAPTALTRAARAAEARPHTVGAAGQAPRPAGPHRVGQGGARRAGGRCAVPCFTLPEAVVGLLVDLLCRRRQRGGTVHATDGFPAQRRPCTCTRDSPTSSTPLPPCPPCIPWPQVWPTVARSRSPATSPRRSTW